MTYFTPSLGGFRAGVSFADDSNRNGATEIGSTSTYNNVSGSGDNIVSGALEYMGDFNGISLGVSAIGENWGEGNLVGGGLNVGFGNFTVGGSYSHTDDDYGFSEGSRNPDDTDQFDVGVSYEMDAAAVSLTYGYAEYGNGSRGNGTGEISTADLGLAYTLGAGVAWKSSIFWFDDEVDGAEDNDGYGVVTGLALTF